MERHCATALEIARWLEEQPQVKSVSYPGLKSHPQHDLARTQMRGFGGMVSMVLKTDLEGTRRFLENTHLFSLAESLGGVESLINHPALMTHASVPKEKRDELGVGDSLVQRFPFQQLHYDERLMAVLANFINGADVRMIER